MKEAHIEGCIEGDEMQVSNELDEFGQYIM